MKLLFTIFTFTFLFTLNLFSLSEVTTLYNFKSVVSQDGDHPRASLVYDGTYLYGTTYYGGTDASDGTIFKIKPDGSDYTIMYRFNHMLDGNFPSGALILIGTTLYGKTESGGDRSTGVGNGEIFKINTDGTGFEVVYALKDGDIGQPIGNLAISGNVLYCMGAKLGTNIGGGIFSYDISTSQYTTLKTFDQTSGITPHGSLTVVGNDLYAMTSAGGANDKGTIFKIGTNGSGFTVLLDFDGTTSGGSPFGGLSLLGTDLYGTTTTGGIDDIGIIFKITTSPFSFVKIKDNVDLGADESIGGPSPTSDFLIDNNKLYGIRYNLIFRMETDGSNLAKLAFKLFYHPSDGSLIMINNELFGASGGMGFGHIYKCPSIAEPELIIDQLSVTCSTAEINTTVLSPDVAVTARGVCWSNVSGPTISDNHTSDGTGIGTFTSNITGLTPGTQNYFVRPYATSSFGTAYGDEMNFSTDPASFPDVMDDIVNIGTITADISSTITSDGCSPVTARGICWNTSGNATISEDHTTDGTGMGVYSSIMSGLTPGTTYYVRAYATNSIGTAYGNELTITPTGINDIQLSTNISIYPNPADHYLNVVINKYYEQLNIRIVDILGNIMNESKFSGCDKDSNIMINTSNLPNGFYFIKIDNIVKSFVISR